MIENSKVYVEKDSFRIGVRDCIPTLFGYLSIGFACGVVSKSCGMTILETACMSTFVYAGSAQFIAASMILSLASAPSIIITIFLVNLRHLLMSASIAPKFKKNSMIKNFTIGALLTDETFALASSKANSKGNLGYKWMMGINVTAYLNWILATLIGAYFSSLIYNYKEFGLDFALPAMFIGLLTSSIKENHKIKRSIIIMLSSMLALIISINFFSVNTGIMIAAIAGACIGGITKK